LDAEGRLTFRGDWENWFADSEAFFLTLSGYWRGGWFVDGGFWLLIEMVVLSCLVRDVLLGWLIGEMSVEVV